MIPRHPQEATVPRILVVSLLALAALLVGAELNAQLEGREDRPLSRVLP